MGLFEERIHFGEDREKIHLSREKFEKYTI